MQQKRLHQKFTPKFDFTGVDHLIVGSGMGGLTAGAWLAKAGKKVVVFERHYVPGGFTHCFKRKDGLQWDTGVHYVGNMHEGEALRKLFDFITSRKVKWNGMGVVYDVAFFGKDRYEFHAGKENFRKQMKSYFPESGAVIDKYLQLLEDSNKRATRFFFQKAFPPFLNATLGKYFRNTFEKYSGRTTREVLLDLTSDEKLISVLCAQCGNYGLSPKYSSFAAHALVIGHFMEGGFYPEGGTDKVACHTMEHIINAGGAVLTHAEVEEIVIERGRVKGVNVGGVFVPCKSVISNVGVHNTFGKLVSAEVKKRCKVDLNPAERAIGHIGLYVGLQGSQEELELPKNNIWYFDNYQIDEMMDGMVLNDAATKYAYISFPSAKDPEWQQMHPDKATIQVLTLGRYDWFKEYEGTRWMKRGEAYEAAKEKLKNEMLETLYKCLPQARGKVIHAEISTPLSTQHFSNYQKGEIYGLAHTPSRFRLPYLRPETRVKGLRLVGQDITIVGLASAMISGMVCAITILKFRVWKLFRDMNR